MPLDDSIYGMGRAINFMSSERWNKVAMKRSNVEPTGKIIQKAFVFLQYAYLNEVGGDISKTTSSRQRRRMHQQLSILSLNVHSKANPAPIRDI